MLRNLKCNLIKLRMRYTARLLSGEVLRAARHFPALIVTGPRRAGKTTLLRRLFPRASYWLTALLD